MGRLRNNILNDLEIIVSVTDEVVSSIVFVSLPGGGESRVGEEGDGVRVGHHY